MRKPDWFILIEQWKPKGMGEYGPTLPFLVGAIAYKSGQTGLSVQHVRDVLNEITQHPMEGYVTEVRWCHDIGAPVFNTRPIDAAYKMPSLVAIPRPSGKGESLVFSQNLQSLVHFNSTSPSVLFDRLIEQAVEPISKGRYSRQRKHGELEYEYGNFQAIDLDYIHKSLMLSQPVNSADPIGRTAD